MGLSLEVSVPVFTVFLQGLLSFFSPCVLPLIPLYIGYLSGGTRQVGEDGKVYFSRKKVMLNTFFFVLGVSFTFFLLGFSASVLGSFFKGSQAIFSRVGGILIMLFGLYQLGIFGQSKTLSKEHRLPFRLDKLAMSPVTALIMGFTFSFAWTPCVGPALSSVLLMTASASTKIWAYVLIGVYTIGFVLPFLAVGLFSTTLLDVFKKHGNVVKYTVKIGGVLMILMGLMMFTGKMNSITGYLTNVTQEKQETKIEENKKEDGEKNEKVKEEKEEKDQTKKELTDALPMELKDQYGNVHNLEDYKGKVIFLNFWATWCPPCRAEMPEIQKLYEEYSAKEDSDVVIMGIAAPSYGREVDQEGIKAFLEENGYTYPVLMDETGEFFTQYGITSFPTTFMITKEGKVYGYVRGQITEDIMRDIISQTLEAK